MNDLLAALINMDYTMSEAKEEIASMRERILEGEDPGELLRDLGLEIDYVMDLLC